MRHFGSQRSTEDVFRGLMRIRGMESGGRSPWAEAFYGRKLVL